MEKEKSPKNICWKNYWANQTHLLDEADKLLTERNSITSMRAESCPVNADRCVGL